MENSRPHPISEILDASLQQLRQLVDVNTIIGDPITTSEGVVIIPVSKVSFGYMTGGSELPTSKPSTPFGGGSGGGVTIQPLAFLVISGGDVSLLQIQTADSTADRIVNMVPSVFDKVSGLIKKNKEENRTAAL